MPRFKISQNTIDNEISVITGDDVKHINRVLRLRAGDEIILFDDQGNEYVSKILTSGKSAIEVRIVKKYSINRESPVRITLLQSLNKGDKMDLIVQKATELGVASIVPVVTERSEVKNTRKIQRWQKIADESTKQCARNNSPKVHNETKFEYAVSKYMSDLNILFYEKETENKLVNLKKKEPSPFTISIFIGPEGGFTDSETALARDYGYLVFTLGPRILRSETASLSSLAIIQHMFGDI